MPVHLAGAIGGLLLPVPSCGRSLGSFFSVLLSIESLRRGFAGGVSHLLGFFSPFISLGGFRRSFPGFSATAG